MGLSAKAMEFLKEYEWPGNVRELRNLIERVVILSKGDEITDGDIRPCLFPGKKKAMPVETGEKNHRKTTSLKDMEEGMIKSAFEMAQGNQRKTAKLLDIKQGHAPVPPQKDGTDGSAGKKAPNK